MARGRLLGGIGVASLDDADRGATADTPAIRRRFAWLSISLSAFIMSLAATLINVFYAAQGAEIVVQPARQILLYRDGESDGAVLAAAMRIELINTASNYGDVLVRSQLVGGKDGPVFAQEGLAQPAFTDQAQDAAANCELGARCVAQQGLIVIQRSDSIMDLPAGSARALSPFFWLVEHSCEGGTKGCEDYADFDRAVDVLSSGDGLDLRVRLTFHDDGEREISCRTGRIDAGYLREIGWTQLACIESTVSGDTLF